MVLAVAVALLHPATSLHAADLASAQSLYNTGHYVEAGTAAAQGIEQGEYDEAWPVLRIRAQMATGDYAGALVTFEAALTKHPSGIALRLIGREVYLYNNQPEAAQSQLATIQALAERSPWRYSDAANRVIIGRTLLLAGAEPRQVLELLYDKARQERPDELDAYIASAELALDKSDDPLAAETLMKAAKLAPQDTHVHYLLARALASDDDKKSAAELAIVLEANPRHVPSLLMKVDDCLDAEDDPGAQSLLKQILEINPREPLAWAYRSVLAHLAGDKQAEQAHRTKALEPWSTNPHVDHLIGRRLARKYRFAEAAASQRKSLQMAPSFTPAKIELSQDLLRLGDEDEGWRLAAEASEQDGYDVVAHNLTTLHEALAKYRTLEDEQFVVRMDAREAEIYGPRAVELLRRAREVLTKKYDVELPQAVIVEIFRDQKDFAARTFGLPGGAGFLGVCFGRVITANSPASQGDHPSNWEAVLWHEFCHVITLTKTKNKMPRWLSEGISVYEESQRNPTWGQAMDPKYRAMILGDDLTPVSKLSGAFLKPPSPRHLQFAYFESSQVVEYLVGRYGLVAVKRILSDLADDVPINQALARHTEPIDKLDAEFAAYIRRKAEEFAAEADWSKLELDDDADLAAVETWNKDHPRHYEGLKRQARLLLAAKKWAEAKPVLLQLEKIDERAALPLIVEAHRNLHEAAEEQAALVKLVGLENDVTDAYTRLMEIAAEAKNWSEVEVNAERMLAVNPLVPAPYRQLARAAAALDHADRAVLARRALLILDTSDPAQAHYELAKLLADEDDLTAARRHVLQALEEAPRFRAAQRLLLEIVRRADEEDMP